MRPSAHASQLGPNLRKSIFPAAEQLFDEAAQQDDPNSMSVSASHPSNWHPLMLDSRSGGTDPTGHAHSRIQAGHSHRRHVGRQSSRTLGLSEPDALGLSGSHTAPPAQQPMHASSISSSYGELHSGMTAGVMASTAQHDQLEMPNSSSEGAQSSSLQVLPQSWLGESAANSAAQAQKVESAEARLDRIHRSLRASAGRSKPQLQADSSDTVFDSEPSMKHEQDSGRLGQNASCAAAGNHTVQIPSPGTASVDISEGKQPAICLFVALFMINLHCKHANDDLETISKM